MSEAVVIAIIGGCFSIAGIITGAIITKKLNKVERDMNGRLTELLELTRKSSNAEGNLEGRLELKDEQKSDKK